MTKDIIEFWERNTKRCFNMQILEFEEIAVGSSPAAVFFAFRKGIPLLLSIKDYRPKSFEFVDFDQDLSDYLLENKKLELVTLDGVMTKGLPVKYIYNKLLLVMATRGHIINADHNAAARLSEEEINLTFTNAFRSKIKFRKCYLFELGDIMSSIEDSSLEHIQPMEIHDYFIIEPGRYIKLDYYEFSGLKYQKDFWTLQRNTQYSSFIVLRSHYTQKQINEGRVTYPKIIEMASKDKIRESGVTGGYKFDLKHDFRITYKESLLNFDCDSIEDCQGNTLDESMKVQMDTMNKHYSDYFTDYFG